MDRNDFASRVVEQTDRMYRIAYVLLHNDEDCRDAMQEAALKAWEKAKPVLDELFRWVESVHYSSKSPWGSAMEYLKNQKAYLLNYLLDGRLEISNNRAELSIKPFVINRKNFLFANTPGGAQGSAVIFSLIQTAIENGLDPWRYLTWLIDMAAKGIVDADGLFPWAAPDSCRVSV